MSSILALYGVKVQGANAVAGLTWGFPALSAFLGFCEALDRRLRSDFNGANGEPLLGGCAIVCHEHQALTDEHYGVHQFTLARSPLTVRGEVAPFNEEGRMHLTVSLLIEVDETIDDFLDSVSDDIPDDVGDERWLADRVRDTAAMMRLAGGVILDIDKVEYHPLSNDEPSDKARRRLLFRCLPGFALIDRSDLLARHHEALREHDPEVTRLTAWMDFGALRYRSHQDDEDRVEWRRVPLPETGWFVPLMTGFQAIGPLVAAGEMPAARDPRVPFQLVESVYGVGQWLSPHRASSIESLMWRRLYTDDGHYSLVNRFTPSPPVTEESA